MDVMVKYGTSVDAREMDRYRSCFTDDLLGRGLRRR